MSIFGERLRELREDKELMSKDFAKLMNVEPATVTNWEKGNRFPKDDVLVKIADFFNVTVDYLLGRDIGYQTFNKSSLDNLSSGYEKNNDNKSSLNDKEIIKIEKEAQEMIDNIEKAEVVEFCGVEADEDDKEFLKMAYEKFLTDVRMYNKIKYTPKKYK